ncbi:hypothetical protein B484DRAFT_445883 [Ochromonadaceae sp. CCMP2298]|nr:hypothetical protein B484DRAFT_445883 [Ochromonadaceae sp. CCMP2298]
MSNILDSLSTSNKDVKSDISAARKKGKELRLDIFASGGLKIPRQSFPEEIISEVCTKAQSILTSALVVRKKINLRRLCEYLNTTMPVLLKRKLEVDASSLCRWMAGKTKRASGENMKKRGRTVNEDFEREVVSRLMIGKLREDGNMEIIANAAFSYDCFRIAAARARDMAKFVGDAALRKLEFTNKWVCGFKKSFKLRRRRCTTSLKKKPNAEAVRAVMLDIQRTIRKEGLLPENIFNEDETAIFACPDLPNQYVPSDAHRAVTPEDGSESRFTALLGASGTGIMLPVFLVLKVSTKATLDLNYVAKKMGKVKMEQLDGDDCIAGWGLDVFPRSADAMYVDEELLTLQIPEAVAAELRDMEEMVAASDEDGGDDYGMGSDDEEVGVVEDRDNFARFISDLCTGEGGSSSSSSPPAVVPVAEAAREAAAAEAAAAEAAAEVTALAEAAAEAAAAAAREKELKRYIRAVRKSAIGEVVVDVVAKLAGEVVAEIIAEIAAAKIAAAEVVAAELAAVEVAAAELAAAELAAAELAAAELAAAQVVAAELAVAEVAVPGRSKRVRKEKDPEEWSRSVNVRWDK